MLAGSVFTDQLFSDLDQSVEPFESAVTLPPVVYTSDEFFEFEKRALFDHDWLCVGLATDLPEVGDWMCKTVNDEPLIIVRDKDLQIRGFSAVCQHRGMQICEGTGNSRTFRCPYHHWTYGLDGRLLGAPAMEKTLEFEKVDWGLPSISVEQWRGFVFVNFDSDAPRLGPSLTRYDSYLENYCLEESVCPGTFMLEDLPWNWKVMFENFNDGYHANKLHEVIQDFCPSELASFPVPWNDESNVVFRENGYIHIDGGFNASHRALLHVFPNLTEEERWRSTFALVPPTLCIGTAPDQAFFFIVHPKSPGSIDVEIGYLLHPSSLEDPMFEHLFGMNDAGVQVFVRQDQDATTKVQRGLSSRFARRGRYSWQEASHVEFNRWLVQRYRKHWPSV